MAGNNSVLVGDVGGTHARFAVVEGAGPMPWRIQNRMDLDQPFPTFSAALGTYLERCGAPAVPSAAVIAVAGPVAAGRAQLTNRHWEISEQALRAQGFGKALLINDFVALAYAIDVLGPSDTVSIGPKLAGMRGAPVSIQGAGTGFGVCCLAHDGDRPVPLSTEGGHISFAPVDDRELAVLQCLRKDFGRVSVERILSGPGLENLHRALQQIAGQAALALSAAQISAAAASGDATCQSALQLFFAIFGSVAGDLALAQGARGGVYIAGGIAQKMQAFLMRSEFRDRFDSKGRMSSYVTAIPTELIVNGDAAFLGAARAGMALV
jgi:glucokinase